MHVTLSSVLDIDVLDIDVDRNNQPEPSSVHFIGYMSNPKYYIISITSIKVPWCNTYIPVHYKYIHSVVYIMETICPNSGAWRTTLLMCLSWNEPIKQNAFHIHSLYVAMWLCGGSVRTLSGLSYNTINGSRKTYMTYMHTKKWS